MSKSFTAYFEDVEYQRIRHASMRGKLRSDFTRNPVSGEVTFKTDNPKRLAAELESIVDFGATTAAEVLGMENWIYR